MNNVIIQSGSSADDQVAVLRSYYSKPISDEIKKMVDCSLDEGAKVVTFEVGCLLQLSIEHADVSEIDLIVSAIKERCMRLYWQNVRSFLILHTDPCYHQVIPL